MCQPQTTKSDAPTSKLSIALAVAALLASGFSAADTPPAKASRSETTGVVTGLAVGAAAGGPFGALLGAASGAWFGDRWHRKNQDRDVLRAQLAATTAQRDTLTQEVSLLTMSLSEMERRLATIETDSVRTDAIAADILFRTDESALRSGDDLLLQQLGALLAARPQWRVAVTGYADPRGAAGYNFELSTARAEAVALALTAGGLARERVDVEGVGATKSLSAMSDLDGMAFERRVEVRLVADGVQTAQRLPARVLP